jgi:adenylate kinase family enzyme
MTTLPPASLDLRRILVVGECCSGKSTLARSLSIQLGAPHVELDALFWGPDWTPRGPAFLADAAALAAGESWVVDGNYRSVRPVLWPRATLVIWLDRSLPRVWWRALRRCVRRSWSREPLWNGNRETWAGTFFSRESLLLWILRTHTRRRREYGEFAKRGEPVPWVVLRSDAEVACFLQARPTARPAPSPA